MTALLQIRPLMPEDAPALQGLIQSVVQELGIYHSEYLSQPEELDDLYTLFSRPRSRYLVITDASGETVLGGGGYACLAGTAPEDGVCELQKMYLASSVRGQGMGRQLLATLVAQAQGDGYRRVYLETVPVMTAAIRLYQQFGFVLLPHRLGDTGHDICTVFMVLDL